MGETRISFSLAQGADVPLEGEFYRGFEPVGGTRKKSWGTELPRTQFRAWSREGKRPTSTSSPRVPLALCSREPWQGPSQAENLGV